MMRVPNLPAPTLDLITFEGGLDTESTRWTVSPGRVQESQNFEISINGGYEGIQGYEIFDGQPSPSTATYSILQVTISGSIEVADEITGATSSATATVIAVVTSTTPNYLVITKVVGTFQDAEDLEVSASVEGVAASTAMPGAASTPKLNAQYENLAADLYRADIAAVPGSGSILGLAWLNDVLYAFRNNAGGTATDIYKSTTSGWTQVALGRELSFTSGGTTEIAEGDTIEGLTSGATADVDRVVLLSGTWAAGDAAGKFILSNQTGTFQAENIEVSGSGDLATIAGNSSAITLSPSGRHETVVANFGGQTGTKRIYGCDGVNRGFELGPDDVYTPIDTGVTNDAPTHVVVHKNHLFFSFSGSAQHSGTGTPYIFSAVFGAAELATGDTITGFKQEPGVQGGATLLIFNRNSIHVLYGSSSSDWNLVRFREEVGAYSYSIQQFGTTFFLDDRGITNIRTAQEYGNFVHATLSRHIQSVINIKKTLIIASCISREKSQYRLFFSDGSALYITTDGSKIKGIMPQQFADTATCAISVEDNTGNEKMFFGGTDGKVYQLDKGTSFDGDSIERFMTFHFSFSRSIRVNKKYLDLTLETEGDGYSEFSLAHQLGYGSASIPQPSATTEIAELSSVNWDSFTWDSFFWDGATLSPKTKKLSGSAENMAIVIRSNSDYFYPLKFNGALIRYLTRRVLRN